jgi:membrane-associated phospholipid phosphatase
MKQPSEPRPVEAPSTAAGERGFRLSTRRILTAVIIAWAALAVLLIFVDLRISQSIADIDSSLGLFIEHYGDIPGLLIILFAGLTAIAQLADRQGGALWALRVVLFLLAVLIVFYVAGELAHPYSGFTSLLRRRWGAFSLIIAAALGLCLWLAWGRAQRFASRHPSFAGLTLRLAFFSYLLFVHGLKGIWGRVRFRDLARGFTNFTPWYHPNGFTGDVSFPSGHTVMGWMLLPLLILVWRRGRAQRVLVLVTVSAWALLVAVSRVFVGAHYASDVLFSTGASVVCYLILIRRRGVIAAEERMSSS